MDDIIFDNFEESIINELIHARKSVKIAVAWLNFENYYNRFTNLISKGIKIEIIVNKDFKNDRYLQLIDDLISKGVFIKMLKMSTKYQYMHHKFCIIDKERALIGSYNWTTNANKNFENLIITDGNLIVSKLLEEFKYLKEVTEKDISSLQRIIKCPNCKEYSPNIMVLQQEGDYQTQVSVYSICQCNTKNLYNDYYDISLYYNLIAISNDYNEKYYECERMQNSTSVYRLDKEYDFKISCYLLRVARSFLIPIHAIGVVAYRTTSSDGNGEWYTKIIWKNRFTTNVIQDEYSVF